jgi:hypothetical protein
MCPLPAPDYENLGYLLRKSSPTYHFKRWRRKEEEEKKKKKKKKKKMQAAKERTSTLITAKVLSSLQDFRTETRE